ncbi:glycosyltransferase family 2 protein [Massilia sp. IC2-477]|uniref:glycosyltransferase family 2 protein n=1 Tax=Massilia sp. IC2-477 TaxID=2887198 RepID=UPI001D11919B|nr:glycosyltransferase family 2 protein [Massilia sp. IC2-477]MCC2957031.1 glycosyltransferase family 2 protein [Massilia sp. IC2-477]
MLTLKQLPEMLSLVIPVYRNEESLDDLLAAIHGLDTSLKGDFEAVFVVDGSPDACYPNLRRRLPGCAFRSQLILLSRNFGSFTAIRTGLEHGKGDRFAVMAADLQEPPQLVLDMNEILVRDEADVILGVREARNDPLSSRIFSRLYWGMYRKFVMPDIPPGGVDMFGCNKFFRDMLLELQEQNTSLVGQLFWLGFRRKTVSYIRQARQHGKSAWTFHKKWRYVMDSLFSFTDLPITLLVRLGALGTMAAGLLGIIVLVARLQGLIDVPGYAMTILTIALLGSINLLGIGIVGSYAWRTYENTKKRPLAIPMKVSVFGSNNERQT